MEGGEDHPCEGTFLMESRNYCRKPGKLQKDGGGGEDHPCKGTFPMKSRNYCGKPRKLQKGWGGVEYETLPVLKMQRDLPLSSDVPVKEPAL